MDNEIGENVQNEVTSRDRSHDGGQEVSDLENEADERGDETRKHVFDLV